MSIDKIMKSEVSKKEIVPEMGTDTSSVFSGEGKGEALKKVYGESAKLFSDLIKKYIPESETEYTIADIGSFKGELLSKILDKLGTDFLVKTIAIDVNEGALEQNTADKKIVSSADLLPIADKSTDISIMRYALQWNPMEKQREMIKEIHRVTKKLAIIQHCCPDDQNSNEWRVHMDDVLDGEEIPKLKRTGHYFASPSEIEKIMNDIGIKFQKISEINVPNVSEIFIERYGLSDNEEKILKELFGKFDYENVVTWVLLPDSSE